MNKKFLAEHQSKSQAEHRQHLKKRIKNPEEPNPLITRLGEMKGPIIQSEPHLHAYDNQKIWAQIPFAGTLIVSIFNVPKEMCLRENGFESTDIPDLIKLSKETNKIKFVLHSNALDYEDLDYLDPFFEELNPPVIYSNHETLGINETEEMKWNAEFMEIAKIKYLHQLKNNVIRSGGNENFVETLIRGRRATWVNMKFLEMDEDLEILSNALIDNPEQAESLLATNIMKTSPLFDPITQNYNYSISRLKQYNVMEESKKMNIKIPEIGTMILKKLVLNPSSYYGCIDTIQKYQDNDLYKLLNSFEEGIKVRNADKIVESKKELEKIVDNVWKDVKQTSSRIKDVKSGLSFAFGIGGTFATSSLQGATSVDPALAPIAALGGLLAGLGFNTYENRFSVKESISEKMIKKLKPNYLVNILDFSKDYNLDR